MAKKSEEPILALERELIVLKADLLDEMKGLGFIPWKGLVNPLAFLLRRRESYLLGRLGGTIVAVDRVTEIIDKGKFRERY